MHDSKHSSHKKLGHFRNILAILVDAYRRLFNDSGVLLIFLGAAFLYPLLYGAIYMNETIREMPIAVVDQSNSVHSRKLIRNIEIGRAHV